MYKRVLLKFSGEQLSGKFDGGIDAELITWLAGEVKKVIDGGSQIVIMVGGGNFARGAQLAGHGIGRVTADNIGMLGTIMNAVALADVFNAAGVSSRALSIVSVDQIADQFTHRRAMSDLEKGHVVVAAGGTGRPYVTTDTAALSFALELECDVVLKATKVDGVYDKDPAKFPDAVKIDAMSFEQAGVPVPAFSSALSFYDSYRSEQLPANLLQAQRDYFGAHTYERTDKPRGEFFHTNWTGHGGDTSSSTYNA